MSQLRPSEQEIFDRLLRVALQDRQFQNRLLCHDCRLQEEYAIPSHLWQALCSVQANSLEDFCRQLYGLPRT
jgi:hypothetical protein